jgi:DNA-directed RNA polymerase specialized sigma24 family protein
MEVVKKEVRKATAYGEVEEVYEKAFPRVAKFVKSMGGTFDDAKDIFHDALVVYFEIKPEKIHSSDQAYILGIAKHLWIQKFNRSRLSVSLDSMEQQIIIPNDYYSEVNNKRLLRILESAGKKCMDLLRAFYYEKLKIKSLVRTLGYSNEHSASVQKYKCLEKVREVVKEKSLAYEDFIE